MKRLWPVLTLGAFLIFLPAAENARLAAAQEPAGFPRFETQEIDRSLRVGYGVILVDVSGNGKKDIVVADATRVVWFENPDWTMRTVVQNQTKPDNVCIDAYDIDGDGLLELALGAGWRGTNTTDPGTLQWLKRGRSPDEPWSVHPIDTEYSVHRVRFVDLDGDGRSELISAPLLGPGTTSQNNWSEKPVRIRTYKIPAGPSDEPWPSEVLDESLHVVHNFWTGDLDGDGRIDILTASYEGVHLLRRSSDGGWKRTQLGSGNQENPQGRRGSSEIKRGRLRDGLPYIATIEPWHGHQVVVYTPPPASLEGPWSRHVVDEELRWGHAVWCADLNGDGNDELIIGVRDPFSEEIGYGVNVYQALDATATRWKKHLLDNGGVAVEDLAAADLDGNGRIDIVAVGRATGNVRIYWNRGLP